MTGGRFVEIPSPVWARKWEFSASTGSLAKESAFWLS